MVQNFTYSLSWQYIKSSFSGFGCFILTEESTCTHMIRGQVSARPSPGVAEQKKIFVPDKKKQNNSMV
jgi:hypothetical protein